MGASDRQLALHACASLFFLQMASGLPSLAAAAKSSGVAWAKDKFVPITAQISENVTLFIVLKAFDSDVITTTGAGL